MSTGMSVGGVPPVLAGTASVVAVTVNVEGIGASVPPAATAPW